MNARLTAPILILVTVLAAPGWAFAPNGRTEVVDCQILGVRIHKRVRSTVTLLPSGQLGPHRLIVRLDLSNVRESTASVTRTDRLLEANISTLEPEGVGPPEPKSLGSLTYLVWRGLRVPGGGELSLGYAVETSLPPPVEVKLAYRVNGERAEVIHSGGLSYLPVSRGDELEIGLVLKSRVYGVVDGEAVSAPVSVMVTFPVDASTLMNVSSDPEPMGRFGFGNTWLYVFAVQLTGEEEVAISVRAQVADRADVGMVRLSSISISAAPSPSGNLTSLMAKRDELKSALNGTRELKRGLQSYSELTSLLQGVVENLTDLAQVLDALSSSSENFTLAISALRTISDALSLEAEYLRIGLARLRRAIKMELYLLEGENYTGETPPPIREALDGLGELAGKISITAGYLNQTVTALENGSGKAFAKLSLLTGELNESLTNLTRALDEVQAGIDEVEGLISSLDSRTEELEASLAELDDVIRVARVRNPLALPPTLGEPTSIRMSLLTNSSAESMGLSVAPQGDDLMDQEEALVLVLEGPSEGYSFALNPQQGPRWVFKFEGSQLLTILLPRMSRNLSTLFGEAGVNVSAPSAPPSALTAWVDVVHAGCADISYKSDLSANQPRLAIEFLPASRPPVPPPTQAEPTSEPRFELKPWMWAPILSVPVLAVALLVAWDVQPEVETTEDEALENLLSRLERLRERNRGEKEVSAR